MQLCHAFDRLVQGFATVHVRYAVVGGVAVALHGFLRATGDLDFLVHDEDLALAQQVVVAAGYWQCHPPWTLTNAPLTLWRYAQPVVSGQEDLQVVDLVVAHGDPYHAMLSRACSLPLDTTAVRVVSREDLVVLRRARGSAVDLDDVEHLVARGDGEHPSPAARAVRQVAELSDFCRYLFKAGYAAGWHRHNPFSLPPPPPPDTVYYRPADLALAEQLRRAAGPEPEWLRKLREEQERSA